MGNNPSRPGGSEPGSPAGPSGHSQSGTHQHGPTGSNRREPRRRDSIHALTAGKATAAPPSESLASATAHPTTQNRPHNLHSRQRSKTIDTPSNKPHGTIEKSGVDQEQDDKPNPEGSPMPIRLPAGLQQESSHFPRTPSDLPYVSSHTNRPPRLPLPIEEEDHTPGSPIIPPADPLQGLQDIDQDTTLPRKSSLFSTTTATDDDEIGDELQSYTVTGGMNRTVPTLIEWKKGGDKVFVTGTFAGWNRKYRLHRTPSKSGLSAILQLPPGTHHLKFIVDGEMKTSDDMPTTVDFTNILVNYVEVNASDVPLSPPTQAEKDSEAQKSVPPQQSTTDGQDPKSMRQDEAGGRPSEMAQPARTFGSTIPQYLLDYDKPDDCPEYMLACTGTGEIPSPPSLPMFLSKSILNGNLPMKDDSSVLNMPNHTVLNHLATSAIKDDVLATSATTRYKRKHVTTILYKPTDDEL